MDLPKKIFMLDDHPTLIEGLKQSMHNVPGFQIVGTFTSFDAMYEALTTDIDILILDIEIKNKKRIKEHNSLDRIEEIKHRHPGIKILVFTQFDQYSFVKKAIDKGVAGYLLKDALTEELIEVLEKVARGEFHLDNRVEYLKEKASTNNKIFTSHFSTYNQLTKREKEITVLLVEGYDTKDIAKHLTISPHTVHTHRKSIFKKLDIHSVTDLVRLYLSKKD